MKILFIRPEIPCVGRKGYQILAYERIRYLSRKHEITVVCFNTNYKTNDEEEQLKKMGVNLILLNRNIIEIILNVLVGRYKNEPMQCSMYRSNKLNKLIHALNKKNNYDIHKAYTSRIMPCVKVLSTDKLIIEFVDSLALNFKNRLNKSKYLKKIIYNYESYLLEKYENKMANLSKLSFVVSDVDQAKIGSNKVRTLPLGINSEHFKNNNNLEYKYDLIFSGNMNYQPNIEAVKWFYNNCWEKLKSKRPTIKWAIVGSNPTKEIIELNNNEGIFVLGRVDSISEIINQSRLAIAPMISGSGMQFKVLEAMACNKIVIASKIGLGDIKAKNLEEILIANNAEEYAELVNKVLDEEFLTRNIENNARKFIETNHSWEAINQKFEKEISNILK